MMLQPESISHFDKGCFKDILRAVSTGNNSLCHTYDSSSNNNNNNNYTIHTSRPRRITDSPPSSETEKADSVIDLCSEVNPQQTSTTLSPLPLFTPNNAPSTVQPHTQQQTITGQKKNKLRKRIDDIDARLKKLEEQFIEMDDGLLNMGTELRNAGNKFKETEKRLIKLLPVSDKTELNEKNLYKLESRVSNLIKTAGNTEKEVLDDVSDIKKDISILRHKIDKVYEYGERLSEALTLKTSVPGVLERLECDWGNVPFVQEMMLKQEELQRHVARLTTQQETLMEENADLRAILLLKFAPPSPPATEPTTKVKKTSVPSEPVFMIRKSQAINKEEPHKLPTTKVSGAVGIQDDITLQAKRKKTSINNNNHDTGSGSEFDTSDSDYDVERANAKKLKVENQQSQFEEESQKYDVYLSMETLYRVVKDNNINVITHQDTDPSTKIMANRAWFPKAESMKCLKDRIRKDHKNFTWTLDQVWNYLNKKYGKNKLRWRHKNTLIGSKMVMVVADMSIWPQDLQ